jgi:hypothetical protein
MTMRRCSRTETGLRMEGFWKLGLLGSSFPPWCESALEEAATEGTCLDGQVSTRSCAGTRTFHRARWQEALVGPAGACRPSVPGKFQLSTLPNHPTSSFFITKTRASRPPLRHEARYIFGPSTFIAA